MTMHLQKGLTTINTRKPKKKKYTQKQLDNLEIQRRRHNKDMRRKNLHSLQLSSLEDYLSYIRGEHKVKDKKEFKEYAPSQPYVRNTEKYPSLKASETIPGYAPRKDPNVYTGTLIKGIGTMHKSNAVPVIDQEQMKDLANMSQ